MALRDVSRNDIWGEAQRIFMDNNNYQKLVWEGVVHTPVGDVVVESILGYQEERDYVSTHFPVRYVTLLVKAGDYVNKLLPNKTNLTLTLTLTENGEPYVMSGFRLGLYDDYDPKAESSDGGLEATDELNHRLLPIEANISALTDELIRKEKITNIPINMSLEKAVKLYYAPKRWSLWDTAPAHPLPTKEQVFGKTNRAIRVGQGRPTYEGEIGVDVIPFHNQTVYEAIIINRGLTLPALIPYLQNEYGLYSQGAGRFHLDGLWYVYPIYNIDRYDNEERTLTVFNIPTDKIPFVERGHRVEDRDVYILANEKTEVIDNRWLSTQEQGDTVRYMDSSVIQDGFARKADNKVYFNRDKAVKNLSLNPRGDLLNEVVETPSFHTSNHLNQEAQLASLNGKLITFIWRNSEPRLLYPGMPVGYFYVEGEVTKKLTGTLLMDYTTYRKENPTNIKEALYARDTVLTLFVSGESS